MRVSEAMSPDVRVATPGQSIRDAAKVMAGIGDAAQTSIGRSLGGRAGTGRNFSLSWFGAGAHSRPRGTRWLVLTKPSTRTSGVVIRVRRRRCRSACGR